MSGGYTERLSREPFLDRIDAARDRISHSSKPVDVFGLSIAVLFGYTLARVVSAGILHPKEAINAFIRIDGLEARRSRVAMYCKPEFLRRLDERVLR